MSTQGRFRVTAAPNDVFVGTAVGDFAISSTNGVFLGALPAGVTGEAHIKLDEEGVVVNQAISALAGLSGDIRTGSITPLISAAGIQVSSGLGTIRLDSVVVDDASVTCSDLTVATVAGATNVTTAALTLPTATLTCPATMTAVRLAPTAALLDVATTASGPATLRVDTVTVQNVTTGSAAALHVAVPLRVDADLDIGTTALIRGAATLNSTLTVQGATLTHGTGAVATLTVAAPYLGISALTQVPNLRFGAAGAVLDGNTWGSRYAARATYFGAGAFFEGNGVVLVDGTTPTASPVCVRHISGTVSSVYVDNGLMARYAPTVAGTCTLVDSTGALTATTSVNTRNDLQSSVQVAAPSYRLLGAGTANEVLLTAPPEGLTSDKRIIAPTYRLGTSSGADLTPVTGGGTQFSTLVNVPQIVLRNVANAATFTTHQTDSDGAARVIAPYLRLAGTGAAVELQPTGTGTRVTPGVLDLSYNTTQATIAYLRVEAAEVGLRLYTPRLYLESGATSLLSSAATGTLTTSNMPTLSLNGVCSIAATSASGKTTTSVVADALTFGTTIKTTLTPEADGVLLGPGADFTVRATTRVSLQSPTTIGLVLRRPDATYARFDFAAGSKGEMRINGRDAGLTPYDSLASATKTGAPDVNSWYTYKDAADNTVFRARRYDLSATLKPFDVAPSTPAFSIPGFVDSTFTGTSTTTYINPLGGTATFRGGWVDLKLPVAVSLKRLQTVLQSANQVDSRPAVWRLFARNGEPGPIEVTDWVEVLRGGTSDITDPSDKEAPVYNCYRLAVSLVTSGTEVRVAALNLWGVDAAPTTVPQNSFTGQHWTVPGSGTDASEFRPGMVVVATGEHDSVDFGGFKARGGVSSITSAAALPRVALTGTARDRRAFGVVDSWRDNVWVPFADRRLVVNSLGEGAVLACSSNGPIRNGDLLQTSAVRGYVERQDSEFVASYTVGKATMDCDFKPRLVPCMRIVVDAAGVPETDDDGLVIWEPTGETERAYETLLLLTQGVAVARVSCVYKCG